MSPPPIEPTTPKVFISYSWTSPEHKQRVKELADRLIGDGVDVIIDIYNLREGQDLNTFMEQMVENPEVTKVLVICDKRYTEKANSRKGGVGTESQIISVEVYQKTDQQKFIALFFESNGGTPHLPTFLKGRLGIDMSTPERESENYETLIRAIHNEPLYRKPALGKRPAYLLEDNTSSSTTRHLLRTIKDSATQSRPHTNTLIKDYISQYTKSLPNFRLDPPLSASTTEENFIKKIHDFIPLRDEFIEFVDLVTDYTDINSSIEQIFDFFEGAATHLVPSSTATSAPTPDECFEPIRFIVFELFIHTITTLIKKQQFSATHTLLSREYYVVIDKYGEADFRSFDHFRSRSKILEDIRSRRLNRISATADLLKERATPVVTFEEIKQTEYILFLYSITHPNYTGLMWYPISLVFAEYSKAFPLFKKAESLRHFNSLKTLFAVENKDELLARYARGDQANRIGGALRFGGGFVFVRIAELGNFDKLATRP